MGMRARPLSWSEADRTELERLSRSQTAPRRLVDRARIILACMEGEAQIAIAARLGTRPSTVGKWRDRFSRLGLKGLGDAPRSGKPTVHVGLRKRVLKMLETPPPKGQAAWDGLSLAKVLGVNKSVRTSSGKIVRGLKSAYRRNGTLNLFAALNVATGEVIKKTTKTKTRLDFRAFMDEVVADEAPDVEIHAILDNDCTHKKNDDWLQAHPNVTFHFTPTSASWLNQVEIWFGILTRKALRGASFNDIQELARAIDGFCDAWHDKAHPFVWRKRDVQGSQIKNTIAKLIGINTSSRRHAADGPSKTRPENDPSRQQCRR